MKNTVTTAFAVALAVACAAACSQREDADANAARNGTSERVDGAANAAGNNGRDTAAADEGTAEIDRRFVADAASGGMMEVELGRVAAQKGESADVKSFGRHMATDHGKANARLKSLAASKQIALPKEMTPEHRAQMEKLSALSGAEFDRRYMDAMVKDHEDDINEFQQFARFGQDEDLKKFAEDALPTLREHLGKAQGIDKDQDAAASANEADVGGDLDD